MNNPKKVLFNAFDPDAEIEFSERNLPHWFQVDAAMFVTFRTMDSLPKDVLLRMQRELEGWLAIKQLPLEIAASTMGVKHSSHEMLLNRLSQMDRVHFRKVADRLFHGALDECHGRCLLRRQELANIVAEAILHHADELYDLDCFVVMPNHVHVMVQFRTEKAKSIVGQSWLRYTARQINLKTSETGAFWQAEPFDHVIRNAEQFNYLRSYVAKNPIKASLRSGEYLLWQRPV
ncbi:MAG: transposase [Planctomycetota bacterium]|nr:transposase [Planctomycetota bacterium]